MSRIIIDLGFLKVAASFIQARKGGVLYYYRRYPKDVRHHFGGKDLKYVSLKTKDMQEALRQVAKLALADDAEWSSLRSPEAEAQGLTTKANREAGRSLLKRLDLKEGAGAPLDAGASLDAQMARIDAIDIFIDHLTGRHGPAYTEARERECRGEYGTSSESFLTPVEAEASRLLTSDPRKPRVLLSEALEEYIKATHDPTSPKREQHARLYVGKVFRIVGDLPLEAYTREHARKVRDKLTGDGLATSSLRRNFNGINAVINYAIREHGLGGVTNHFKGLLADRRNEEGPETPPFTTEELKAIAQACMARDDDIRHLIALQLDTGARIGEVVGLRREDVIMDDGVPHIFIRPHPKLGRRLKTKNSRRRVPLVGMSLWAAQRALKATERASDGWLFPRYSADNNIKSTQASAAVNGWIAKSLKIDKQSHSFRHSMKDRLTRVEAPQAIIDAIGGWKDQSSMASHYGEGPALPQLKGWLDRVVISGA